MHIRKAVSSDAGELSALLNEIIRAGGTTALETPLSAAEFADWFIDGEFPLACHVAEHNRSLVGFQSLSLYGDLPKGVADIATFARMKPKTAGVGSALFPATLAAAESSSSNSSMRPSAPTMSAALAITRRWALRPMTGWSRFRFRTGRPSTGSRSVSA
ncbi:UNVERIFIED_ORG: L-amino acid N-acyltransferase YncA [Rhizobium aethiopicum]